MEILKKIFEVDARGRFVEEREFIKPTNGENLFTTLDIEAQQVAYDQMDNRRGAVVAIEIDSGSIVSYVSTPSFSTNAISNGISSRAFNELIQDNDKPFFVDLIQYMTSEPVVIQVLAGDNAVKKYREIMGATNPDNADDGTIRKLFALNVQENSVHGSDSDENARKEIDFFFNANEIVG